MATVQIIAEAGTRSPAISAKQLELVAMDETNGTTQAVAEANSTILNAYFATGWETQGLTLELAGKGYAIWNTIDIAREGFTIRGSGNGDTRAEIEYDGISGAVSRLVCINPSLDVMINYTGAFITWDGVMLQGWWHATSNSALKAATSSFCDVGIYQGVQNSGKGTGKLIAPKGLTFSCFTTAMQFGADYSGDNADQWNIPMLRTLDCGTGFHVKCRQSVGFLVGQYEGTRCGRLFYFERGGKLRCDQATLENGTTTLLQTRAQLFDDNSFWFGDVYVDGTVGSAVATIWQHDANVPFGDDGIDDVTSPNDDEPTPSVFVRIGLLHVGVNVTTAPRISMYGYGRLHILSGEQLYDNMVTVNVGESTFMNEILLQNARFRSGEDPTNFVAMAGTTGYARVKLVNNGNVGNVPYNDEYKFLSRVAGVTTPTAYDPENVE